MVTKSRMLLSAASLGLIACPALAIDGFQCTLGTATTGSYTLNASAPFTGTMVGDTTATPATRTKVGTRAFPALPIISCGTFGATQNDPITISGSIVASGQNTTIRPTGRFAIFIDPAGGTASVRDLQLDLLGGMATSVNAGLSSFRYQDTCAINPTCSLPFLTPISLTLGSLNVTAITAVQTPGVTTGTLTPATTGYDFLIPVTVEVTPAASFNGAPFDIAPQTLPVALTGRIEVAADGQSATVTSTIDLGIQPPSTTTPTVLPTTPFTTPAGSPLCAGLNLLLNLTLTSSTVTVDATASVNASGPRLRCPCDWNQTGTVTVQDIFDFLNGYFNGNADFNGVGGTTVQDIFDFLLCYFNRPLPC